MTTSRRRPGEVRDAIVAFLKERKGTGATVAEVHGAVVESIGDVARSSVRSYLQLGREIERIGRGRYKWKG